MFLTAAAVDGWNDPVTRRVGMIPTRPGFSNQPEADVTGTRLLISSFTY